MKGKFQRTSL